MNKYAIITYNILDCDKGELTDRALIRYGQEINFYGSPKFRYVKILSPFKANNRNKYRLDYYIPGGPAMIYKFEEENDESAKLIFEVG